MKKNALRVLVAVVVVLTSSTGAFAWWWIEISSASYISGTEGVSAWIRVANTTGLSGLVVPIVVRSESDGAFWTGNLPVYCEGNEHGVTWGYDTGEAVEKELCTVYDGVSPDYFQFTMNPLNSHPTLFTRLRLDFDVAPVPGQFVFDTGAFPDGFGTIYMLDDQFPPVDHGPTGTGEAIFTKGTIDVADCDCFVKGDINHDGSADPMDVVWIVVGFLRPNVKYVPDRPFCPYPKGDVNCDGATDPLDVQFLVQYIYKGQDALCDGCVD